MVEQTLSTAPHKVVAGWVEAMNGHDIPRITSHYSDDLYVEDVAVKLTITDRDEVTRICEAWFAAIPDLTWNVSFVVATTEGAAVEWVVTGTYQHESAEMPAGAVLGSRIRLPGASVLRFDSDLKITRQRDAYNLVDLLATLGITTVSTGDWR